MSNIDRETKFYLELVKDYALDYLEKSLERNVYPTVEAIDRLVEFDERLPEETGNPVKILETLNEYGSDATVSQIGGRYFGFVNGGVFPVSLAARWIADVWDQNSALNVMSPIATKLEQVCESWLKELFGLPNKVVAGFVSGSSLAIMCGLAAGRYRIFKNLNWDVNANGLNGAPKIRILVGEKAHATVMKAIAILGFGVSNIEWMETDDQGRIIPEKTPHPDERTIIVLQAGNVCTGCFDPFEEICEKANNAGAWIHVDGAFGLWVAASTTLSYLTKGMEKANSFSVDGHKTLNTPYDNGIILCDDEDALTHALHATGSYIIRGNDREGMFYTPEMSRRARSIELWATLKYLGKRGVDELVTRLNKLAVKFSELLRGYGFNVINSVVFNQIIVSCDTDQLTKRTLQLIQESGECWVGGASWNGKEVIRISVSSWVTSEEDIDRSAKVFSNALKQVKEA